jgi:hypothetical protein
MAMQTVKTCELEASRRSNLSGVCVCVCELHPKWVVWRGVEGPYERIEEL